MEELRKQIIECYICGKYGKAIDDNPCLDVIEAEQKNCINYKDYLDDRAVMINSYEGKYRNGNTL